ncbi:hypothetical protein H9N25_04910 [Pedobacter riviphilus]|uniref:Lipocalin-like domain-containing protein n=1 Tax=Pedobacter riviphilus TaxID=2766984 RepID=A0ABX6TQN6_9SPHI|nr:MULTISPECIES: hypothetical protein [Pedobacter]NII81987.1 hypothetical protein [Pedobacter sp. SG908]NMN35991.1 hypothetical protein [Pedobacter sp. SG918]QNR85800.1 hypothetical protein H9N25_04910 [Pedobacter riviphilus]
MKSISKNLSLLFFTLALTLLFSCKGKDKDVPSNNSDEAAAARVAGTYKGTVDITSTEYFNAIIQVTKENGNKVKVTAKPGEPYSNVTSKIFTIKAIQGSNDAEAIGAPEGTLVYGHAAKNIVIVTLPTASGDISFNFRGTKQ